MTQLQEQRQKEQRQKKQSQKEQKPTPAKAASAASPALPPSPTHQQRATVLAAMCLALFMTNFDGTAGDLALPQIQKGFGSNMLGVQWYLNAYHLPVASLLLASGKFGDFFGRKKIFVLGLSIFTVSSLLCGLAPSLPVLIGVRSLQGIGAAALIPLSLTIVTATYTEEAERTKAIGIWSAVSALAMVAGPGLGGLLIDSLSWRSVFFVNLPLGLLTLVLTSRAFHERRALARSALNLPSILLSVLSVACLTYLLTEGSADIAAWQTRIMLAATTLSFALFAWAEARSQKPLIPPALIRNRRFLVICATQMLVFFMSGGLFFILSLFLQHVQGYSATLTGLCFLPMNGAIIAASFASGWVVAKRGWRFPILTGLAMVSAAIYSLTHISAETGYLEILGTLVLAGFGGGLTIPPLAAGAMNAVRTAEEGIASAISSISIQFGGILGIGLQGAVFSAWLGADLRQTMADWQLPAATENYLVENALQHFAQMPASLPMAVSPVALERAVKAAFVSGLQATLWVALIAILLGLFAITALVPPRKNRPGT
ncbi:MAG: MFS transporter [Cyanobacteria bacterium J06627_32]